MNYEEFKPPPDPKDWDTTSEDLLAIAKKMEQAGADCIILCANTPHMAADVIRKNTGIPLIHIAEETAKEIAKHNIKKVALLGTKLTMEQPFFRRKLSDHGIETIISEDVERSFINSTIFNELGKGIFPEEIKKEIFTNYQSLRGKGAEGIILGCTEIPMLIKPDDCAYSFLILL